MKKKGLICRNRDEWIECQEILLNIGFEWRSNGKKLIEYGTYNIIILNDEEHELTCGKINEVYIDFKPIIVEAKVFIRNHKLKKIYEN